MNQPKAQQIHPLTAAAAVAVILVCMVGVGVLTGVLPDLRGSISGATRQPVTRAASPAPSVESTLSAGETMMPTVPTAPTTSTTSTTTRKSGAASDPDTFSTSGGSGAGTSAGGAPGSALAAAASAPVALGAPARSDAPVAPLSGPRQGLPAVYVHVLNEAAREQVRRLAPALADRGVVVTGIKVVEVGPSVSDLRYFHGGEKNEAQSVRQVLMGLGLPARRLKRIAGFEPVATPHQYELWLASDFNASSLRR